MSFLENKTIAVVDSGIGGLSILKQLISQNKVGNYIYFADNQFMPYGNKSKTTIKKRIEIIITTLKQNYKADYIIVACNTASSCLDNDKNNIITMKFNTEQTYLATTLTKENNKHINIIADNNLAKLIEKNIFNSKKLKTTIGTHIKKHNLNKYQELVLGCTHYELVNDIFKQLLPKTKILNNSDYIVNDLPKINHNELNIQIITSKQSKQYYEKIIKIIKG